MRSALPRPTNRDLAFLFEDPGQRVFRLDTNVAAVVTERYSLRQSFPVYSVDFVEWDGNAWCELTYYDGFPTEADALHAMREVYPHAVEVR